MCETHKCAITVSGCLARQKRQTNPAAREYYKIPNDPKCADCKQGKQVKKGIYKPIKEAFMNARAELDELEAAAKTRTQAEPDRQETKVCRDCEKPFPATTAYFYKHRSNADGLDTRCKVCSREAKRPKGPAAKTGPKPVKPAETRSKKVIQVDFTNHPHLVDRLEEIAQAQFRTPELQILAMINACGR
jgi:hypothetical protein